MSIFRNDNESAYVGGRKHWTDVIKNSGDGSLLLWRQPEEDFNTNSTLIVMPGEQAIFIKDGTVEQVFDNGKYRLSTENYPFISRLRNAFSGGVSTFNCVVYFVRKADSRELLWGTPEPISVLDKVYNISTGIQARGSYKVRIVNPAVFLEKLLGNNVFFQEQGDLDSYFSNEFQQYIQSALGMFFQDYQKDLRDSLAANCSNIARELTPQINEVISRYGLALTSFTIASMQANRADYAEIDAARKEAYAERFRRQGVALGQKDALDTLGQDWGRVTGAEVLSQIATNPGAGGMAAAGAGLGMGLGAGSAFGSIANAVFAPTVANMAPTNTPSFNTGRFDMDAPSNPASPPAASQNDSNDAVAVLQKLKTLLDANLITQAEYDAKKAEVLERM